MYGRATHLQNCRSSNSGRGASPEKGVMRVSELIPVMLLLLIILRENR